MWTEESRDYFSKTTLGAGASRRVRLEAGASDKRLLQHFILLQHFWWELNMVWVRMVAMGMLRNGHVLDLKVQQTGLMDRLGVGK